jgi:hypothetical protein
MTSFTTPRFTIFLAAIAAALAVTCSAVAAPRPDDRAGVRGASGTTAPAQVVAGDPGLSARPDNRAGVLGIGTDASVTAGTSDGFDWTAAGIGAGATGAFVVLVGAAAMLAMPRRQRAIA